MFNYNHRFVLALILCLSIATCSGKSVLAHPGGYAADGCHNVSATGERHCKDGTIARLAPTEPIHYPPPLPEFDAPTKRQMYIYTENPDGNIDIQMFLLHDDPLLHNDPK